MKTFHQGWCRRGLVCSLLVFFLFACQLYLSSTNAFAGGGTRPRVQPVEDSWNQHRPPAVVPRRNPASLSFNLRVLTYNVHGMPLPGLDHSRYNDIGSLLKQRRRAGTAPHVVVLQEMVDVHTEELIVQAGYPYRADGASGGGLQISSGLVILSEFPLKNVHWIVYNFCTSWDCFARKGVMQADVVVPGLPRPLKIFNTHMNSNPELDFWTPTRESVQARITQMQEMREFIADTRGPQSAIILAGDFNFRQGEEDYESLFSFLTLQDAAVVCARTASCVGQTVAEDNSPTAIDHQFYDSSGAGLQIDTISYEKVFKDRYRGRLLSDHDGIETVLRLSW